MNKRIINKKLKKRISSFKRNYKLMTKLIPHKEIDNIYSIIEYTKKNGNTILVIGEYHQFVVNNIFNKFITEYIDKIKNKKNIIIELEYNDYEEYEHSSYNMVELQDYAINNNLQINYFDRRPFQELKDFFNVKIDKTISNITNKKDIKSIITIFNCAKIKYNSILEEVIEIKKKYKLNKGYIEFINNFIQSKKNIIYEITKNIFNINKLNINDNCNYIDDDQNKYIKYISYKNIKLINVDTFYQINFLLIELTDFRLINNFFDEYSYIILLGNYHAQHLYSMFKNFKHIKILDRSGF